VIDHFRTGGTTFLMPGEGTPLDAGSMIDISHESLIRLWAQLGQWAEAEAEWARAYERLAEAARGYYTVHRVTDLWRGLQLEDALDRSQQNGWNEAWAAR
jgi:hypothetical protein